MSVEEKVKEIVAEQLGVSLDQVKPEAKFVEDLGADSLDLTELIMAMEDEFDVEIDDDKAQEIKTVQDAINFIKSNT
ncbi:acyl carrier protein [Desulfonauticus submarinus]